MKENRENQCSPEGRGGGRAGFGEGVGKRVKISHVKGVAGTRGPQL